MKTASIGNSSKIAKKLQAHTCENYSHSLTLCIKIVNRNLSNLKTQVPNKAVFYDMAMFHKYKIVQPRIFEAATTQCPWNCRQDCKK